jgi:signal transduction histidine kinase
MTSGPKTTATEPLSRARRLLDAVAGVASDLILPDVLHRIVSSARELVDADYAALAVVGPAHRLIEFVHVHVLGEDGTRTPAAVIDDMPTPLSLHDLVDRPQSFGVPLGRPRMSAMLTVPVQARGAHFGDLHLARECGGAEFTEDDQATVGALTAAGGIAIDNARLFEQTHERELWLRASNEITGALLGDEDAPTAFALVARQARAVARGHVAAIVCPRKNASDLVLGGVDGDDGGVVPGATLPRAATAVRQVMVTDTPRLIADAGGNSADWLGSRVKRTGALGSAVLVPLAVGRYRLGVLMVARHRDAPPFTEADMRRAGIFAEHAALAIEFARAREDHQRLAVLEDRDRIARDLHDLVVQRLFAVNLGVQSLVRLAGPGVIADRATGLITDLDQTVREIRHSIFSLHEVPVGTTSLRGDLLRAGEEAAGTLGFTPRIDLLGALDTLVPDDVRPDLLAAVREALTNVARHAAASAAWVEVSVNSTGSLLQLVVRDDGRGVGAALSRHSGLANLDERATRWGGDFDIRSEPGCGLSLRWTVPLTPMVT